ncbi:hypothetical protein SADUNF_Sadunf17G0075500 [Salix dunnii]|uniref:Uncharacterized protein n=1 Tax=Salix dunnii TaxID=1413687 RepID=A0A835MEN5_9ROSI|nr:hypothetical protein SADUNF_Sadunf17G0075500 [Salix dunnii]
MGVFVDDLFPDGEEVFTSSASSLNIKDAHQIILEYDTCINSHCKDHPTIVSLSSGSMFCVFHKIKPIFALCCAIGKIKLPVAPSRPQFLDELLNPNNGSSSIKF